MENVYGFPSYKLNYKILIFLEGIGSSLTVWMSSYELIYLVCTFNFYKLFDECVFILSLKFCLSGLVIVVNFDNGND